VVPARPRGAPEDPRRTPHEALVEGVDLEHLADETGGTPALRIASLCREAALIAIERVADEHGEAANIITPTRSGSPLTTSRRLRLVRPATP